MLTIGRLGRGATRYYAESLRHEDGYDGPAEDAGRWRGRGAARLGLRGAVAPEDLSAVLDGRHPRTDEALLMRRHAKRRAGFDLSLSAPKGVSLLGLLTNGAVRAEVGAAHRSAVHQAIDDLENRAAWVRRGFGGCEYLPADGLVEAVFEHTTSRAQDPQLHAHVLVANVAHGPDGRWSSPDGSAFYAYAITTGYLYEAALRAELTERLGVEWRPVVHGLSEPAAFSRAQLRAFSTRTEQIKEEMAKAGGHSRRSNQVANVRTREPKEHGPERSTIVAAWQIRAEMAGIDLPSITRDFARRRRPKLDHERLRAELTGPSGLRSDGWFDTGAVLRAVAERARAGASVRDVARA
ncbi:MAG: relaxase domain-containing protein, partial [Acidimicrobiales bacterium]|nr:relaxase domain-containing protein [Acidimicrobiales bacterium]